MLVKPEVPDNISKVIRILRLYLIIMVVYIHSTPFRSGIFSNYDFIKDIISNNICSIAVPLFFLFSGYLFFWGVEVFSVDVYIKKLKKRFRSLVLPYILWSLAVIFLLLILQTVLPGFFSASFPLVQEFTIKDWANALWIEPIQYQFWFIRDLIVCIILTPFIYLFIKYLKVLSVLLFAIMYLFSVKIPISGLSIISLFFFMTGAFFSLKNIDFTRINYLKFFLILYCLLLAVSVVLKPNCIIDGLAHNICTLIGVVCALSLVERKSSMLDKLPIVFYDSEFFIYAFHAIPILVTMRVLDKIGLLNNENQVILSFFIVPVVIISISILLYYFLKKFFPKFTSIIVGGR